MLIRKVFWLIQFTTAEQTCWFSYFVIIHLFACRMFAKINHILKEGFFANLMRMSKNIFNAVVLQSFDE